MNRLCPYCKKGHLKPVSEVKSYSEIIRFYGCEKCSYRFAETGPTMVSSLNVNII
jgi:C4-type Zn-finger protein